jgi:hypothetical protein
MTDEVNHIKAIQAFIDTVCAIGNETKESDKELKEMKNLIKNSILERTLTKLILQYNCKTYDLYNILHYCKDNKENKNNNTETAYPHLNLIFKNLMASLKNNKALEFYYK